jgi:hypothetical protein
VQNKGVSVVSIAASEAARRETKPLASGQLDSQPEKFSFRPLIYLGVGVFLFGAAAGLVAFVFLNQQSPLPPHTVGVTPFIAIDATTPVILPPDVNSPGAMKALVDAKNKESLALGLMAQLYVEQAGTSTDIQPTYVSAQQFLTLIAPTLPDTFTRTIAPVYLLGVHSFGNNQPFLIFKVDSYEQGYAGMLAWETTMKHDLSPLFDYTPVPKTQTASTTATSTAPSFIDSIVVNHDARVLKDQYGTIDFLWTFLDHSTVVITTNPDTLREIVSRLTQTPVSATPGVQ